MTPDLSTALGAVILFVGVCLVRAIVIVLQTAREANAKAALLATSLLESKQSCKELAHEADYWRGLVKWKDEHTDRSPTQEECDLMWERIVAQKPQFVIPPAATVVVTPLGHLAHYATLDELTGPQR